MAVPKGKISKARRDKRRNSHWKLSLPGMTKCPKCGEMKLAHRMCMFHDDMLPYQFRFLLLHNTIHLQYEHTDDILLVFFQ